MPIVGCSFFLIHHVCFLVQTEAQIVREGRGAVVLCTTHRARCQPLVQSRNTLPFALSEPPIRRVPDSYRPYDIYDIYDI